MKLKAISTDKAPAAIGPYSQAIQAGNLLFCSGQIPLDPVYRRDCCRWMCASRPNR